MSLRYPCTDKGNIYLYQHPDKRFCSKCKKGLLYWDWDSGLIVCDKCDFKRNPSYNEEIQHRFFCNERLYCMDGHGIMINWDKDIFVCIIGGKLSDPIFSNCKHK